MKSLAILTCTLLLPAVFSCGTVREKNQKKEETSDLQKAELVDNLDAFRNSADVTILDVRVVQNSLELDVEYSGGCETHEFRLLGSTMIQKSLPPKRGVLLFHDNKGDSCRSIESQTLRFDISVLAYEGGEIILNLEGWKTPVSYTKIP
ncbi:MAG: hypothetical protein HYZ14_09790 [Bacteroidetes bacterium]|nr:hypothetical protein [Bacteroidota bacterium]